MMESDASQLPLIIFDDVDEAPRTFVSHGQNEEAASASNLSAESVYRATLSVCGASGVQDFDSRGPGEASGGERTAEQRTDLDPAGMEDMIQKMLKKYGETEKQEDDIMTPSRATPQDPEKSTVAGKKREADSSVSDMIQRESSKWDRVYGTEENHTSGTTRNRTGRQEIARRPVTSTEDGLADHVEIGSVIRSQTGVARQLISVSAGLDEVNDDLEDMKRELKRIQTKSYSCLDGGREVLGGQTVQEFAPIGFSRDSDIYGSRRRNEWVEEVGISRDTDIYGGRRRNEWVEEREGVVRFDDGNSVLEKERYWKAHPATVPCLPGVGRAHIKESDVHVAHLLTIAEPDGPYRQQTRLLADDDSVKRERHVDVDRFGRPIAQFVSIEESPSKHSGDHWRGRASQRKPDGYCYMCEEFGDIHTERKSKPTHEEPSRLVHRSYDHAYGPLSVSDLDQSIRPRSRDGQGIYRTPSGVYFYSDDVGNYPDEASLLDPANGITRSSYNVRQSSVPRGGLQSQGSSVSVQRPLLQHTQPSSTVFTSKFLTKVRRRNSLGARVDTDRHRAQTLKGY